VIMGSVAVAENEALTAWFNRTGWSRGELARQVCARARATGNPQVTPDSNSVRRWFFEGRQPRPPVPDLIADVISERVGVRVSPAELGLAESPARDRALVYDPSFAATVDVVTDLGRADVERRKILMSAIFAGAASVAPSREWLLSTLTAEPKRRIGDGDVQSVTNMFSVFQEMDVMQGGGSARLTLAAYMNEHVYPLLRARKTATVHDSLLRATAEQSYLLGWMAYDNGEHALAQRYLIQALRLAQESTDTALGAHVLAGMADQATLMGNPAEGVRLAQTGRLGLREGTSHACLADLYALEARAHAAMGDAAAADLAIGRSQQTFAGVDYETEPEWARFIDTAYLNGEYATAMRDVNRPADAAQYARVSISAARAQKRARRGAMSQAVLASAHLQDRNLEAAHAAGLRTIELAGRVKSSRTIDSVTDLRTRMNTVGRHALVTDYSNRTRELLDAA
jgi:hypothetical protein